jgi:hypothetical protein
MFMQAGAARVCLTGRRHAAPQNMRDSSAQGFDGLHVRSSKAERCCSHAASGQLIALESPPVRGRSALVWAATAYRVVLRRCSYIGPWSSPAAVQACGRYTDVLLWRVLGGDADWLTVWRSLTGGSSENL